MKCRPKELFDFKIVVGIEPEYENGVKMPDFILHYNDDSEELISRACLKDSGVEIGTYYVSIDRQHEGSTDWGGNYLSSEVFDRMFEEVEELPQ